MAEAAAEDVLAPSKWTEAGYEAIQGLVSVCQKRGIEQAEAEHLGISLLTGRSLACRVVIAAGGDPVSLRKGFDAVAGVTGAKPKQFPDTFGGDRTAFAPPKAKRASFGGMEGEPPELGASVRSLLRKAVKQQRELEDELLSAEHVLLALTEETCCKRAEALGLAPAAAASTPIPSSAWQLSRCPGCP